MALVHRVNTNISPLLGTFYCKCVVNITRFKTGTVFKKKLKPAYDDQSSSSHKTFAQMLSFRQDQAKKSILVKVNSMDVASELESFCSRHGKVVNAFPYTTVNSNNFLLIELESTRNVEHLKEVATYKLDTDCVRMTSPLFFYKTREFWLYAHKAKAPDKQRVHGYSSFLTPPSQEIEKRLRKARTVSDQMMLLYDELKFKELNIRLRFYTAEEMSYYLSKLFTNISVVPFGSSVNGFGQQGCDLDLLCKVNNDTMDNAWKKFLVLAQPFFITDRTEQKEFLESVCVIMKTCIPGIGHIKKILEARVPIIKFYNLHTNMQCDLSSTNMVALHMSELLYMYGQLDWRVKPLVCTIRKWARNCGLTKDSSGQWITNFSLTLLVIFYLQTRNVLPSLNSVKYYAERYKVANNLSSSVPSWFQKWKQLERADNEETLHGLLYGFFEYYSIFDFKMQGICIREGKLKPKKDRAALYIYNPFDLTLNVSKNITSLELSRIVDQFRNALHILLEFDEATTVIQLVCMKQNVAYRQTERGGVAMKSLGEKHGDSDSGNDGSDGNESVDENECASRDGTGGAENARESIIK